MKKYYRKRFILGSMAAYVILFIIVIGAITLFTYIQMDRDANQFLSSMINRGQNETPSFSQNPTPPIFGYQQRQRPFPTSFYDITTDEEGQILSWNRYGTFDEDEETVRQHVSDIICAHLSSGKIASYQFVARQEDDGQVHLILMDNSIQIRTIYDVGKSALAVGFLLMLLLFIILMPVSSRVADAFVQNTENQKQFITNAGHELKTPVAIMRSNLDMLELTGGKSKWSSNIRGQVDRMEHLLKQLILLSRLDERREKAIKENVQFSELFVSELDTYRQSMDQKEIDCETHIAPGIVLSCDRDTIIQLIHALLDNLVQYAAHPGKAQIAVQQDHNKMFLKVENEVNVLPETPPEKLLERFARGDTARTQKNGGTGIGLSAAKTVAEMHKGSILVSYPDTKHFCVQVTLPLG